MITLTDLYDVLAEGRYTLYASDGEIIMVFRIDMDDKLRIEDLLSDYLLDTNIIEIDNFDITLDI